MARLGNLWFDLKLNDLTDAEINKIKKKLRSLNHSIRLGVDTTDFDRAIADARRRLSGTGNQGIRVRADISGATSAINSLSGTLNNLKGQIEGLFGGYLVQQFLQNIVNIGGEFEYQQKAIESILGSATKASNVFEKIQALAIKSPFGAMDLTKYAKQLTAYSIPYSELYDTLKRIADISAGVGVDMGRIILAYGQVKSAGFLRGTEARQFAEANIPVVQALADKYSELEGRIVSVGEVYDRMSSREIPFKDLQEVLFAMAEEGGQFADMQEKLSDTTKAVWKNFADAIYQMYYEIGESNSGIIKGTGLLLTELAQNWKTLAPVVVTLATAYGTARLASVAYQTIAGKELVTTVKQIASDRERQVSMIQQAASYRALTTEEGKLLTMNGKGITSTRRLSAEYLNLQMQLGKLSKDDFLRGLHYGTFSASQGRSLAAMSGSMVNIAEVNRALGGANAVTQTLSRRFPTLAQGFSVVGRAAKNAGKAIGNFIKANWIVLAISVVVEGIMYLINANKALEESAKQTADAAKEAYDSITEELKKLEKVDFKELDTVSLKNSIKEMDELIRNSVEGWGELLNRAYYDENTGDPLGLADVAKNMKEILTYQQEAAKFASDNPEVYKGALGDTGGFLDDNLIEDIKDYVESYQDIFLSLSDASREADKVSRITNYFITSRNKEVRDLYQSLDAGMSFMDKMKAMYEKYPAAVSAALFMSGGNVGTHNRDLQELESELNTFFSGLKTRMSAFGIDLKKDVKFTKALIIQQMQDILPAFEGLADDVRDSIINRAAMGQFNFPLTFTFKGGTIDDALAGWQEEMINAINSAEPATSLNVSAVRGAKNFPEAVEKIQNAYKGAREEMEKLDDMLSTRGYNIESMTSEQLGNNAKISLIGQSIRDYFSQAQKAKRTIEEAHRAAEYGNFLLEQTKKQAKRTSPGGNVDKVAEAWKKRLALIQDADEAYRRWNELVGKDDAIAKLRDSGLFDELEKNFDFSKARELYRKALSEMVPKTEKQENVVQSGIKLTLDWDEDELKESIRRAVDNLQEYIDKQGKGWDLFGKIFELTGDETYAFNQAFRSLNEVWSKGSEQLRDTFASMLEGNDTGLAISDFNFHEDKSSMEKMLGKDSALMKMWEEIKERIESDGIDLKIRTAEAIEEMMTAREKVEKLRNQMNDELAKAPDEQSRNALEKSWQKQISAAEFEVFKQDIGWERVFGDLERVSLGTIDNMTRLISEYAKQTGLGVEETKALQEALENLRNRRMEIVSPLTSFAEATRELRRWTQIRDSMVTDTTDVNGKRVTRDEVNDKIESSLSDQNRAVERGVQLLQSVNAGITQIGGLLSTLGQDWAADISNVLGGALGGASQLGNSMTSLGSLLGMSGQALKSMGYAGMAIGAVSGIVQSAIQIHDGKLQKMIEESQRRVNLMQHIQNSIDTHIAHALGDGSRLITDDMREEFDRLSQIQSTYERLKSGGPISLVDLRGLTASGDEFERLMRLKKAYDEQGTYGYDLQMLKEQEAELELQRQAEWEKTNTDYDQLQSYDEQLRELREQIQYYWQDLGSELYGIDFKDWASQLSDALQEAVENGEDAWKAYENTVGDIIKDLAAQWAATNILEPAMNDVMEAVFGEGGFFQNNGRLDESEIKAIGDMMKEGEISSAVEAMIELFKNFNTWFPTGESNSGGSLDKIGNELTEETGSLIASYVNAIRADVSVIRMLNEQLYGEGVPEMNNIARSQLTELRRIEENTSRNADSAEEISKLLRGVTSGSKKIYIA